MFGNSYFLGIELDNTGEGEAFSEEQLETMERIVLMWLRLHGWGVRRVIGHKEWTQRKVDPDLDMDVIRNRLSRQLVPAHNPAQELLSMARRIAELDARIKKLEGRET